VLKIILLVTVAEIFTAAGQMLFKKSANAADSYNLRRLDTHAMFLKDVMANPALWGGFAAMGAGLAVWILALSQGDLSLVFSLGSMQYIMILFGAHYFLGEKIDRMKSIGTFLVVLGIVLITLSH
jgi:drug/metabolite transporter (DMT)-like permease